MTTLNDIDPSLGELVRMVVDSLFVLFNFARIHEDQIDYLVRRFQEES
ncbi:MAG TPA: hypothetical protein VG869_11415 [Acidimicrobiia bacterium]|nr:hypothetical protein [Acidimicrobiia bacterium]